MGQFKPVSSKADFPKLEEELVKYWYKFGIVKKYLERNKDVDKKFSFLDGPITANNPMGVHHAWGRTYKDLWQRFYNMRGFKQRFQNGFDEQGLWVEVEVEKELGLKSKKDIENLIPGDKFKSLEKFINLCKERVKKYSAIQTEQSKRLGYFMDWDHSYHTSFDENNFAIWNYLKIIYEKEWLYKGRDSVPWCPRCGTAISQHEIETEGYQLLTHESIYFKLPIKGGDNEYLLVWTTTPWTIPANVAVAVNPKEMYVAFRGKDDEKLWVMDKRLQILNMGEPLDKRVGKELVGLEYNGPFDEFQLIRDSLRAYHHKVIDGGEIVTETEGTGLLHVAPGSGPEDFQLGLKENLPVIALIEEDGSYIPGMEEFTGKNAKNNPELIIEYLKDKDNGKFFVKTEKYQHRYPTCWRCSTELVWRVVDEWYIAMDKKDESGKTYREQMIEVAKKINWIPKWGLDRELDWLNNMHDWLISKKRYWGLALPIWECQKCGNFQIISSKEELKAKSIEGWERFEGHSPHRPWIDQIKIKCSKCDELVLRIPDVGNPWLDAGIVPFSTLPKDWFPADFVNEQFAGQFKNWFYSMIAMSSVLANTNPFKILFGYATVKDDLGEDMHKSKGNAIEFNDAAGRIGADVMRWMYMTQNPEINLNFGFNAAANVKRRFYLILWNCYKFFIDYANFANWNCELKRGKLTILDKWILARLTEVVVLVNDKLEKYDVSTASRAIEDFVVNDFSTWYIRRSRGRVGPEADVNDRNICLSVMYGILVALTKLLAPFIPFITEEMFKNLTKDESVHLTDYPRGDKTFLNDDLVRDMEMVREIAEKVHAKRKEVGIKLRQPLVSLTYEGINRLESELEQILSDEVNIKKIEYIKSSANKPKVQLDTNITQDLKEEGEARELIRQIQQTRKEMGLTLSDKTKIELPSWPKKFEELILKSTASVHILKADKLQILKA